MIAVFLSPLYVVINNLIFLVFLRWLCTLHGLFNFRISQVVLFALFMFNALALVIGFFMQESEAKRILMRLGTQWIGILGIIVMVLIGVKIIHAIARRTPLKESVFFTVPGHRLIGTGVIILIFSLVMIGSMHANALKVVHYTIQTDKDLPGGSIKVALAADWHLGYAVGEAQMQQMVDKINAEKVDLVCFGGDYFDNSYTAIENPEVIKETLKTITSTYGVYGCMGNHDINEAILAGFTFKTDQEKAVDPNFETFLEGSGIQILSDEQTIPVEGIVLVGRKDPERAEKMNTTRQSATEVLEGINPEAYCIVLDHEPKELEALAENGADLDLGGHVHDGQTFPGNILANRVWENPLGMEKVEQMYSIVTAGVGTWGPKMRLGTDADIMIIEIQSIK